MNVYDLGDEVLLQHRVYNAAGALVSATVNLTVTAPDGTTTTPSITEVSTGIFEATVPTDQLGLWTFRWSASGTVTLDYSDGQFSVVTSAPPMYASLVDLKASLAISTDTTRDTLLVSALVGASRAIDRRCGRRFYADKTVSARTYAVHGRMFGRACELSLLVDDIASATDLAVEIGSGTSFTAIDVYETGPENAAARGEPITYLTFVSLYPYFATVRVRVTARWGYPAIPDDISQATLLYAARLFRRKDSPEGVAGTTEWGSIRVSSRDPDVEALIAPYILPAFA